MKRNFCDEKCEDSEPNESQTKLNEFKINRRRQQGPTRVFDQECVATDELSQVNDECLAAEEPNEMEDHSTADESSVVDGRSTCE